MSRAKLCGFAGCDGPAKPLRRELLFYDTASRLQSSKSPLVVARVGVANVALSAMLEFAQASHRVGDGAFDA
jgi:hypothetical protein